MKPLLSDESIRAILDWYDGLSENEHHRRLHSYSDSVVTRIVKKALSEQSNIIVDWLEKEADKLQEKHFASAATYRAIAKQLREE